MSLWKRKVTLDIGPAGGTAKSYTGFRVGFDVKMSASSTPNQATIEAYNLNTDSIAAAQKADAVVRLWVGYDVPRLIFVGNPVENGVRLDRRGPDRILHIEAQDGGAVYKASRLNVSFATRTTLGQVLTEVTAQLGIPVAALEYDRSFVFPFGLALVGPVRDCLDRLADSTGSQWFIRDESLCFLPAGSNTGEEAIVFSSAAGNLIGAPSPKDKGVEVTALLAPTLRPGRVFKLESLDYHGFYTATDVQFKGDSGWDKAFYVTTIGTPRS